MFQKKDKTIKMKNYWWMSKLFFFLEKQRIVRALKGFDIKIEHIGSTAIKHCKSRKEIDLAIGLENLEYGKQFISILQKLKYQYLPDFNFGSRLYLKKKTRVFSFILYVEVLHGDQWKNHIYFKNYLNTHAEIRKKYSTLKYNLSKIHSKNVKMYNYGKSPYIEKVLKLAFQKYEESDYENTYIVC